MVDTGSQSRIVWLRSAAVLIAILPAIGSALPPDPQLMLTRLDPSPNYPLTADPDDAAQLTDGRTTPFPSWTKRASVGWSERSPVILEGEVRRKADGSTPAKLRLRVGAGAKADVRPPRRVDVYCSGTTSVHRHAGAYLSAGSSFPAEAMVWIEVPLQLACQRSIAIVVHADGRYLMLDEVALDGEREGESLVDQSRSGLFGSDEIRADSTARLRASLLAASDPTAIPADVGHRSPITVWLSEPWGVLGNVPEATDRRLSLSRDLVHGWREHWVIGIHNAGGSTSRIHVRGSTTSASAPTIERLEPVLAANGALVHDAVVDLRSGAVDVPPGKLRYLLVSQQPEAGRFATDVSLISDEWDGATLRTTLDVRAAPRASVREPMAVVWGYPSDSPVWTARTDASVRRQFERAGINVRVIHPDDVPLPGDRPDNAARKRRLVNALRSGNADTTFLLYLGWETRHEVDPESTGPLPELRQWATLLAATLRQEGIGTERWALYPYDEPDTRELRQLAVVIREVREATRAARFYANPGRLSPTDVIPGGAVYGLRNVVDIWQPQLGVASDLMATAAPIFGPHQLWLYYVGLAPAKANPPDCYLELAAVAADVGANGLGAWSATDSEGRSAWDDFDGSGPDWALLYDGDDAVIRSRRWDAFAAGMEMLRTDLACKAIVAAGKALPDACPIVARRLERARVVGSCARVR